MLALYKRTLFAVLFLVTGAQRIQYAPEYEPWQTLSGCVFITGAFLLVYCICEAIQLVWRRFGRSVSSFTVQTHVGAVILILLGTFIGHGDPRLEGSARWLLALGPALMFYLYRGFWVIVGRLVDRLFSSDRKPARRARKG